MITQISFQSVWLFFMFLYFRARDTAGLQCWKCEDTDSHQRERSDVNAFMICRKKHCWAWINFHNHTVELWTYDYLSCTHNRLYIMCVCVFLPVVKDPSPEELLRQLQEERTCKVCMDKLVSIVFIPCGHLVVCGDCAASLRHCPICRAVIRGSVRAFMSWGCSEKPPKLKVLHEWPWVFLCTH